MTKTEMLIARSRARKFAYEVRGSNLAMFLPDEWEELSDEQIRYALEVLPEFGVTRRSDFRWERKQY